MVEDGQPATLGSIIEQSVIGRWSNASHFPARFELPVGYAAKIDFVRSGFPS
jgi:hypothetical protein